VAGTTTDNVAVWDVFYQFDGGAWALAHTTNNWTNWTTNVTLTPGSNTVRAYAVDTSGSISTNRITSPLLYRRDFPVGPDEWPRNGQPQLQQ